MYDSEVVITLTTYWMMENLPYRDPLYSTEACREAFAEELLEDLYETHNFKAEVIWGGEVKIQVNETSNGWGKSDVVFYVDRSMNAVRDGECFVRFTRIGLVYASRRTSLHFQNSEIGYELTGRMLSWRVKVHTVAPKPYKVYVTHDFKRVCDFLKYVEEVAPFEAWYTLGK